MCLKSAVRTKIRRIRSVHLDTFFLGDCLKSIDDGSFLHQVSVVPTLSAKNTSCIRKIVRQKSCAPKQSLDQESCVPKPEAFQKKAHFHQKPVSPENSYTRNPLHFTPKNI